MENIDKQQMMVANEKLHSFYNRVILKKSVITSYYRMFAIFQSVLDSHGIEFFAHSGTMLGCVRHKGIIPWDDDVDVMIEEKFEETLLNIAPELESLGIKLKTNEQKLMTKNKLVWEALLLLLNLFKYFLGS